jgi:hypothetical protein
VVEIDDAQRRARMASRHRLAPPSRSDDPLEIADSLVALHSSDPVSVYLSVTARQRHASFEPLEAALYDDRTLVRHHAMRRTIWVMPIDTAIDAHAASTQTIAAAERRRTMKAAGWSESFMEQSINELVDLIARKGPITTREIGLLRPDLTERVTLGVGTRNPASIATHTRLLLHAGFEAKIVRGRPSGSWISSEYAWHETVRWLGRPIANGDTIPAAARIIRRWLQAFGPGTETDLRWWTGWSAAKTRHALEEVGAVEVGLSDGSCGYVLESDIGDVDDPGPWVALLPGLDPTAMGWKERSWYLDDATAERVVERNGNIGPTIWADGRIVGGWVQRPDGTIATEINQPISSALRKLLAHEVERLVATLGETRFRTRFPAPNQAALLA